MKRLQITKDIFEKFAPVAIDGQNEIFDSLEEYFNSAWDCLVCELIGVNNGDRIADVCEMDHENDESLNDQSFGVQGCSIVVIKHNIYRYVVSKAMSVVIPQLDLVLTNNGFGIVSTDHVAPASKERVQRLIDQCCNERDKAFDNLIRMMPGNSLTDCIKNGMAFNRVTNSIIWTVEDMQKYCNVDNVCCYRDDLNKCRSQIAIAERYICSKISFKVWKEIIEWMRGNRIKFDKDLMEECMTRLYGWFSEIMSRIKNDSFSRDTVIDDEDEFLSFLEDNISTFSVLINTPQEDARTFDKYQNDDKDKCFFF